MRDAMTTIRRSSALKPIGESAFFAVPTIRGNTTRSCTVSTCVSCPSRADLL